MFDEDLNELVAFYNVENLFPPDLPPVHKLDPTNSGLRNWDERKYKNKIFKVAHVFQLLKEKENILPMLIGLSEVSGEKPLQELIALEPFNSNFGVVHYDSLDERGVDVALLYDKNKIEIISSEPISYFFEIEDRNPANYDTTRDILHCKAKYSGEIINIFVLHLPSKREKDINEPKRTFILSKLREKVLEISSTSNEAVIICGDFNENPDEDNINNLLYDNEVNRILINPYLTLYKEQKFSTYHYKDGLLFDQILFSKQFFDEDSPLTLENSYVFNHEKLAVWEKKLAGRPFRTFAGTRYLGGYSDHFPVYSKLKKNKKI